MRDMYFYYEKHLVSIANYLHSKSIAYHCKYKIIPMDFFKKITQKLFNSNAVDLHKDEQAIPLVSELYKRKQDQEDDFSRWKITGRQKEMMDSIFNQLLEKRSGVSEAQDVFFFLSPVSNGFYFTCENKINQTESFHVFDALQENILKLSYKSYVSDVKHFHYKDYIKRQYRHYCKPIQSMSENNQIDQQYGNIEIEFITINDTPNYIKLMVNQYHDSAYEKAKNFDELLPLLFGIR